MGQLFSKNFCYRQSIVASSSTATALGTPPPIVESSCVMNTTTSGAAAAASNVKREDVQILRALAILSVLAFHLFPSQFPNGYLGVDMFFVISGYLMARILRKKANPPSTSPAASFQTLTRPIVRTFYWRRIKRIFPAYIFDILCVLLAAPFLLIGTELELVKADAKWATLFASNVQNILHKSVYAEVVSKLKYGIAVNSLIDRF